MLFESNNIEVAAGYLLPVVSKILCNLVLVVLEFCWLTLDSPRIYPFRVRVRLIMMKHEFPPLMYCCIFCIAFV